MSPASYVIRQQGQTDHAQGPVAHVYSGSQGSTAHRVHLAADYVTGQHGSLDGDEFVEVVVTVEDLVMVRWFWIGKGKGMLVGNVKELYRDLIL